MGKVVSGPWPWMSVRAVCAWRLFFMCVSGEVAFDASL